MDVEQKIDIMLKESHWLWTNDYDFLLSITRQIKHGKNLSEKQVEVIHNIYARFIGNKHPSPKIFGGGYSRLGRKK